MTPAEINQLAAARMLAATLHNALKSAREELAVRDGNSPQVRIIDDALAHNEPSILALLKDAHSAARMRALKLVAEEVVAAQADPDHSELMTEQAIAKLCDVLNTLP